MYKVVPFVLLSRRLVFLAVFLAVTGFIANALAVTNLVRIVDFAFQPVNSAINAGDSITWSNTAALNFHDSTNRPPSGPGLWGSPQLGPKGAFTFTFTNAGFYPYFCNVHRLTHPEQTGNVSVASVNLAPVVSLTSPTN